MKIPLYVDIDGTLLKTNIAVETAVSFLKEHPLHAFLLPLWFLRGLACAKRKIAERATFDPATLPYREDFLTFLREERKTRDLILATGSDELLGGKIAEHLKIFSDVLGSDGKSNLTGKRKLKAIREHAQGKPFAYAGNEEVDLVLWKAADEAIVAGASASLLKRAQRDANVTHVFGDTHSKIRGVMDALRPYYWLKNLLLLTPLAVARVFSTSLALDSVIAIVSFSFASSAIYLINDLLDLEADRRNSWKRFRPIASGRLTFRMTFLLIALLLIASFVTAAFLPVTFSIVLIGYLVNAVLYSLFFKNIPFADACFRAFFNVLRLLAGIAATSIPIASPLLASAGCFFLGSQCIKSFTERSERSALVFGITASAVAIVLFAASFIPPLLATLAFLTLLILRMWMLTLKRSIKGDPIAHFLRDPVTLVLMLGTALAFFLGI